MRTLKQSIRRQLDLLRASGVALACALTLLSACGGGSGGGGTGETSAQAAPLSAFSSSQHYAVVRFDRPVSGAVAADFRILGPTGASLPVLDSQPGGRADEVLLTTGPQESVTYTLTFQGGGTTSRQLALVGDPLAEPTLETAIALSPTTILLTFSQSMFEGTQNAAFYEVVSADGSTPRSVVAAVLNLDGTQVVLTTNAMDHIEYRVRATNIFSRDNVRIDPTANQGTFFGYTTDDSEPPEVLGAVATSATTVLVSFSEPLRASAANPSFYDITTGDNGEVQLVVIAAELTGQRTQVRLTTLPQIAGELYQLYVGQVVDDHGNVLRQNPDFNAAQFQAASSSGLPDAAALPHVVSAVAVTNQLVIVQFSKPMSDDVLLPYNYVIVPTEPGREAALLPITSASFSGMTRTLVRLTTGPQSAIRYEISVAGVTDTNGNPLAPPDGGSEIGPMSALFSGIAPSTGDSVDSDSDGLSDEVELRGWLVTVQLGNGTLVERYVTSDPYVADSDGDGLSDDLEYREVSDPRRADTDGDKLPDAREDNISSTLASVDSDADGISDGTEAFDFKTNPLVADSDGDGFSDYQEVFELSRNPRLADLPLHEVSVGQVSLQIDERLTYVDESGRTVSEESSTNASLQQSQETTFSNSSSLTLSATVNASIKGGLSDSERFLPFVQGEAGFSTSSEFSMQTSQESAAATESAYEQSLAKGLELSRTASVTREVVGARIDVGVNLKNTSDVAFSIQNVEISMLAADPLDHTGLTPIATLLPNSTLITGAPASFNLGPLDPARGPILFSNREVFPNLVEDLMRSPRGMTFRVVNYDIVDEFGRNFAFASQTVHDRTAGITVDYGDGTIERFRVLASPVYDASLNGGVGGFLGQSDARGRPTGIPLSYALEDILQLENQTDAAVITTGPNGLPETLRAPGSDDVQGYAPVNNGGSYSPFEVVVYAGVNGTIDTVLRGDDQLDYLPVHPDAILAGQDGIVESFAAGDDVQLINGGLFGLRDDSIAITAGDDGILQSNFRGDDRPARIGGYATTKTCNAATTPVIVAGADGQIDSDPRGDDDLTPGVPPPPPPTSCCLAQSGPGCDDPTCAACVGGFLPTCTSEIWDPFCTLLATSDNTCKFSCACALPPPPIDVIGAGGNLFIDSIPRGDDVYRGPGIPCRADSDCLGGSCSARAALSRFKHRQNGQFGRYWTMITPELRQIGIDFDKILLFPGDDIAFAFVQDRDRDGVIAQKEYEFGSSDTLSDTDSDKLGDFSEIYEGWEVAAHDGDLITKVFPDPRIGDSDGDGLDDYEEQDLRRVRCECSSTGAACTASSDCPGSTCINALPIGVQSACRNAGNCATCPAEATRTNPRRRDSDGDRIEDGAEVLGFLSGIGIADLGSFRILCVGGSRAGRVCASNNDCPDGAGGFARCDLIDPPGVILAGPDRSADTEACHARRCAAGTNVGSSCIRDVNCPGGSCDLNSPLSDCDDIQIIPQGTLGVHPRSVVIGAGLDGVLDSSPYYLPGLNNDLDNSPALDEQLNRGNQTADTRAVGDDRQLIRFGDPAESDQVIIKPGINGVLDTLPGGDDVLFQGVLFKVTDPLDRDTDLDQVADGIERILGSDPTNGADSGAFLDTDADGLSDAEEASGWTSQINSVATTFFSNPNVPDSDLDGLPDFVEKDLGSNPNSRDTDSDTLDDYDELSLDQFAEYKRLNDFFTGFFIDGSASKHYGTNPTKIDTDGDLVSDAYELLVGYFITVPGQSVVRHVYSDPNRADTDGDLLTDIDEFARKTDPTDPDTDGDGRLDGAEVTRGSNPLVKDIGVTVKYSQVRLMGGPSNWIFEFNVQGSSMAYPGLTVSSSGLNCPFGVPVTTTCSSYCTIPSASTFLPWGPGRADVTLTAGQGLTFNGFLDGFANCSGTTDVVSCKMPFHRSFSYETLASQGFQSLEIMLSNTGSQACAATLIVEITVD